MTRTRRPASRRTTVLAVTAVTVGAIAAGSAAMAGAASPDAVTSGSPSVSVLPQRTIRTLIGTAWTVTLGGPTTPPDAAPTTTAAPAPTTSAPVVAPTTPAAQQSAPVTVPSVPSTLLGPVWAGPPSTFTSATGVWHAIVTGVATAANSQAMVADLVSHVTDRYNGVAAFNAHAYDVSFVTAPLGTPTTDVQFWDCQGKGYTPAGLTGPGGQFTAVPIPLGAQPAPGTDAEMSVYSPATDQLWEFWEAKHDSSGWSACWGGRIDHVSQSDGIFGGGFGATATGLAEAQGMVSIADVQSGHIDHAIALELPSPATWTSFSWPAQRSDGSSTSPNAVPEGTRLRLDPTIDVTKLGLTPIATMIAKAAQTYGFVVTDQAGATSIVAQDPSVQQALTGVDPWASLEHGVPDYAILKNFPWSSLQALPKDYGKH